jgi:hypothetical protein
MGVPEQAEPSAPEPYKRAPFATAGTGTPRPLGDTMLYSSTGDGEAAMTCRQVWHRR